MQLLQKSEFIEIVKKLQTFKTKMTHSDQKLYSSVKLVLSRLKT